MCGKKDAKFTRDSCSLRWTCTKTGGVKFDRECLAGVEGIKHYRICDMEVILESQDNVLNEGVLYHYYYPKGRGHCVDRLVKQLAVL